LPTSLPNQAGEGEGARTISYVLQGVADLVGVSIRTDGFRIVVADRPPVRRVAVCRYRLDPSVVSADVDAVPPLSRRYRKGRGGRIAILSTTWQTVSLMTPQDQGYRAFITELHRRMKAAGSKASLTGGIGTVSYATAVAMLALLAIAMVGLLVRALATSEFTGALFLVGIAIWFAWTIGGFIKRNRPRDIRSTRFPRHCCRNLFAIKRHEM
jgi:hypothetical protein